MDNDFDLSPLKTKWDFFLGRMEGDENLETQRLNSTEIKLSMVSHFFVEASGNSYSHGIPRSPLSPAAGGNMESTPPVTNPSALCLFSISHFVLNTSSCPFRANRSE